MAFSVTSAKLRHVGFAVLIGFALIVSLGGEKDALQGQVSQQEVCDSVGVEWGCFMNDGQCTCNNNRGWGGCDPSCGAGTPDMNRDNCGIESENPDMCDSGDCVWYPDEEAQYCHTLNGPTETDRNNTCSLGRGLDCDADKFCNPFYTPAICTTSPDCAGDSFLADVGEFCNYKCKKSDESSGMVECWGDGQAVMCEYENPGPDNDQFTSPKVCRLFAELCPGGGIRGEGIVGDPCGDQAPYPCVWKDPIRGWQMATEGLGWQGMFNCKEELECLDDDGMQGSSGGTCVGSGDNGGDDPVCGDGNKEGNEECDDGNTANNDGCSSVCKDETCGDGIEQSNEECDMGLSNSNTSVCTAACKDAICGDEFIRAEVETCDDGNTTNGDGCSSTCTIERPPLPAHCEAGEDSDPSEVPDLIRECSKKCNNGVIPTNDECCPFFTWETQCACAANYPIDPTAHNAESVDRDKLPDFASACESTCAGKPYTVHCNYGCQANGPDLCACICTEAKCNYDFYCDDDETSTSCPLDCPPSGEATCPDLPTPVCEAKSSSSSSSNGNFTCCVGVGDWDDQCIPASEPCPGLLTGPEYPTKDACGKVCNASSSSSSFSSSSNSSKITCDPDTVDPEPDQDCTNPIWEEEIQYFDEHVISSVEGDIDGDGDVDIVAVVESTIKGAGPNEVEVVLYENIGVGYTPHYLTSRLVYRNPVYISLGDSNSDGHMDITLNVPLAAGRGRMFMSLINDGNSPPEFSIQTQNQFQNVDVIEGKLLTLDFDGNGMTDFLAIRGGRVYFTKTESTNPFKSVERTTRDQAFEVAVGDINGDCLDDIVGVSHEKLFWISYSEEKFMETYFIDGMEPTHYLVHLQVTDMNGDGFADISGTLDGKFVWYENDGEDEPSFTKHTIDIVGFDFPPQFVDINGDGITDIITADIVSVHLFLSPDFEEQIITVNSHFIPTVRRPSSLITDFSVADMDGDGSADIRIVRADQIVILKLSCPASSSSSSSEIIIRSSASSIAAFCGDGIINNNEECDSGTFCSGDGFSCLTDSNCVDTSVCVFDDEPPAPPPNNSLQLHSARVQGDFLQMSYSKDFETCLHIWKKQENGFFGRFDMILNFMCTKGANKNVQIDMNTLGEKLSPGQRIKLCHGNEGLSRCTNEYTVTGSSGAFRNFFKNLFAQTTLGQLTLHSLRHREPGTLTIVYSFDSPSRAPVNFQVQDSTGRWSSLMGITGGSISPGSNVSMGFGTGKKCYYPEFGTAMRMCHTGTTNCSNIARVQTVQKISPIPSYCEGSARSIASTQSVASVQSAPATLNPITLHRIEHQWSGDSLTIEYSFAAQSWEKIDVQFADSFGVWSNLMGIVGNSMQPGVHMQVGYGTGRQCYYPDFGTLMRLCYQGTQNCSNTVTVPVVQKLDPLPSWCEDESDQKAGRCGGLSDGKSCDSNADCASEINSCVYNPFADITCGDDCKRIPISSSSSSSSINSEVKLPNFSSSSSSSQCEVVDCVAPPFGCRYINPEFEDGCMQRCGQMVCETEDNSSSSTSTRVSISIQSSSAAISARSLLSVTLSTRSIGLSSYSSSSIDEDDEIIGNDDDDNFGSSSSLRQLPSCGNGKIEATEQCDSGVSACGPRRACDLNTCTCYPTRPLVTTCGDGDLDTGEQCDVGVVSCEFGRVCDLRICTCILVEVSDDNGDGDEDDGVFANNPSVESIIAMNSITETISAAASICGNGVLEPPEECDDQNRRDEDGCTSTCLLEIGICGDGIVQSLLGEQCEQSTHNQSLPYSCNNCRFLSLFCGDNKLDPGEECDAGARNSTSPDAPCRPDCGSPRCGDAILDSAESCDDGNRLNKDGCDRYCRNEGGTQIAFDNTDTSDTKVAGENIDASSPPFPTTPYDLRYGSFPQYPNFQQLPYQLPLAQLQPMIQAQGPVGDTGPAAVAVIGAGAAAGFSWIRRKRRK